MMAEVWQSYGSAAGIAANAAFRNEKLKTLESDKEMSLARLFR